MEQPSSVSQAQPAYKLYVASAFGAFMLSVGDLLNNGTSATVIKVSEVIRTLYPPLENGGLMALLGLVALGAAMCWIFRPATLADAFARGFSIYAVLTVAAPFQAPGALDNPKGGGAVTPTSFIIAPAYAQPADGAAGEVSVTIEPPERRTVDKATVTLRDRASGEIVGRGVVQGNTFSIRQPQGRYVLEIESEGLRRSTAEIVIDQQQGAVRVPVDSSPVPLPFQRLYAPESVELK